MALSQKKDGSPLLFYFYITEVIVNLIATVWSHVYAYCLFSAFLNGNEL